MKKIYLTLTGMFLLAAVAVAQTPYASYPLDGNADDVAGNNLDGTIFGSPNTTSNRYSQNGKALEFDGSEYIDLPSDFDFPNRTVMLWFNVSQVPSGNGNVLYSSDHNAITYGSTYFQVYNSNVLRMGSGTHSYEVNISMNTWYQVAIARTPLLLKFYVNGQMVSTVPNPNSSHSANGVNHATVAADRTYGALAIGKIDDLSIYDVALTDAQIDVVYTSLKETHDIDNSLTVVNTGGLYGYSLDETLLDDITNVELLDINGRVVSELAVQPKCVRQASSLASGTYFLKFSIVGSTRPVVRKIMIENN